MYVGLAALEAKWTPCVERDVCEAVFGIFSRCHQLRKGHLRKAQVARVDRLFANNHIVQVSILIADNIAELFFTMAAALMISKFGLKSESRAYGQIGIGYGRPA